MNARALPFVPPPIEHESLGSWLARVSAEYDLSVSDLLRHTGITHRRSQSGWVNLSALTPAQLELIARRLRIGTRKLRQMNAPAWMVTQLDAEFGFCPRCIGEDRNTGRPVHWRREWLDAFCMGCSIHHVPLHPINAAILGKARHGQRAEAILWNALAHPDHHERTIIQARFDSAWVLQRAVFEALCQEELMQRYQLPTRAAVRQVAADVLAALLMSDQFLHRGSVAMRVACLYECDTLVPRLTVMSVQRIDQPITRLKSFAARCFALSIVDVLLFESTQPLRRREPSLLSESVLRHEWLWAFMPWDSRDALRERSQKWPANYVQRYWPELMMPAKPAMMRRSNKRPYLADRPLIVPRPAVPFSRY